MGASASAPTAPKSMKRIVLTRQAANVEDATLTVEHDVPVPVPKRGEVLVKMVAAPVNPSDYGKLKNPTPDASFQPVPMGNEGSGIVIASGGGLIANGLVGKPVGVVNLKKQGTWSEYVTASATMAAFPLPMEMLPNVEDAASFYVNPYTAYAIVDTVRKRGAKGFIHTGAASQLGQMLTKYVSTIASDMTILHIVRREEQATTLRELGAAHVLVSAADDFRASLKAKVRELGLTIAFDCVAGEMTSILVDALPRQRGSTCYVYGRLSKQDAMVAPIDLIYHAKSVEGFLVAGQGKQAWLDMTSGPRHGWHSAQAGGAGAAASRTRQGGWAESKFVDDDREDACHFLEMLKTGFTDRKLRNRIGIRGGGRGIWCEPGGGNCPPSTTVGTRYAYASEM